MRRLLCLLFVLSVLFPQGFADERANELELYPREKALGYYFIREDSEFLLLQYDAPNDSGTAVIFSKNGMFSGEISLPCTYDAAKVTVSVSTLGGRQILRGTAVTQSAVREVPILTFNAPCAATSKVRDLAITAVNGGVSFTFTAPGRETVYAKVETPEETHLYTLYADADYAYFCTSLLPLTYAENKATVSIITVNSSYILASDTFMLPFIAPKTAEQAKAGPLSGITVCIDAGHQRTTKVETVLLGPGLKGTTTTTVGMARGTNTKRMESIVTLEIACMLRNMLLSQGASVVMTRHEQDTFVGMVERAEIANEAEADFALRLHCNSRSSDSVQGIRIYCPEGSDYAEAVADEKTYTIYGETLLKAMQAATKQQTGGVALSNRYVGNNWSRMPSFLVEMGYMSNPEEDYLLSHPVYQLRLCDGMVKGIALLAQMRGLVNPE